jgi:hypothetical protein
MGYAPLHLGHAVKSPTQAMGLPISEGMWVTDMTLPHLFNGIQVWTIGGKILYFNIARSEFVDLETAFMCGQVIQYCNIIIVQFPGKYFFHISTKHLFINSAVKNYTFCISTQSDG